MKLRRENMPKKFELTLVCRAGDKFELQSINKVEADNMVELTSQFLIVVAQVMQELHAREIAELHDNFPF